MIIQSKVVDIRDRRERKTWTKLSRSVQTEFVSNPANPDNVISSWKMGETNPEFRRSVDFITDTRLSSFFTPTVLSTCQHNQFFFRALAQVDCHELRDWAYGLYYETLLSLLDAEVHTHGGTEYIRAEYGVIGVDKWDGLGATRRFVTGRQSTKSYSKDYRFDSYVTGPDGRTFQGKMQADLIRLVTTLIMSISIQWTFLSSTLVNPY